MSVVASNVSAAADGRLRSFVCALLYAALAFWLLSSDWLLGPIMEPIESRFHLSGMSAGRVSFFEVINLATALLLTWVFAMYERRRIDSYGLPVREAFKGRFWEGFALGVVHAGLVALGMIALGGMTVHGLALHGTAILWGALAWLATNLLVGLAEEMLFRGYFLQALWRSLGFWPAAILIALWFAADHYFFKEGENVWDVITLVSFSLILCYTLLRTGTLWLAVGYHAAFDYMQLFVIGTKNGNVEPTGHLLDVSFQGPDWVTGGVLGTEASFLMYPTIVLLFLYLWWRFGRQGKGIQPT